MSVSSRCPQCDALLAADAPEGICPKCLMGLGLGAGVGAAARAIAETAPPTPPGAQFAPPSPAELAPHFPHLEVLGLLGQGGMGAVYKARQRELDRVVALKILPPTAAEDPSFAERFSREAKTLARMNHPHIVAVHEVGQRGGYYFFVMEFVDGVNLRQAIQAKTLAPQESLAVVRQICDALDYAHGLGIVHRDIKPDNVLINKQGGVKIADFGLAKLLSKSEADITLTQAHQAMGTPLYMAPEQLLRPQEVDHRADIYSLGVVFYELLTGELPMGRFDPPSHKIQVDVRLDQIVLKALEREPDRRYQQASQVKTEIESVRFDSRESAAKPAPSDALPDHVLRRRMAAVALVEITLAQVAFAGLTWGYLSDAEWFSNQAAPYRMLGGWWLGMGVASLVSLAWWWYLQAKDPATPRSLTDFMRRWQTPDPRMKKLAPWLLGLVALWLATVGTAFALTSDDHIHTLVFTAGFLLGPYVMMVAVWNAYRVPPLTDAPKGGALSSVSSHADELDEPRQIATARLRLAGPAKGLMIGGVALVVSAILSVAVLYQKFFVLDESIRALQRNDVVEFGFLAAQALTVPVAILAFLAAAGMKRLQMRGLAKFASGLMLLPLTPGWLITFPLGVWSLLVLADSEVRSAFGPRVLRADAEPGIQPDHRSTWVCAVLSLVVFVLGLLGSMFLLVLAPPDRGSAVFMLFVGAMVVAVVLGLIGFRHRMGRYTAGAAFLLAAAVVTLIPVATVETNRKQQPVIRVESASLAPPVRSPEKEAKEQ